MNNVAYNLTIAIMYEMLEEIRCKCNTILEGVVRIEKFNEKILVNDVGCHVDGRVFSGLRKW